MATHVETLANLEAIRSIIRQFRPDAHILFSVSPIPLTATFRPVSCLTADAVSKAIIRGALDEFLRNNDKDNCLHYMPSYEAVTRLFNNQWTVDRRHILRFNMQMFETFFCNPGLAREHLAETFRCTTEEDLKRSEEKREKRRQVRIQERINSRAAGRQLKEAERKDHVRSKGVIVAAVTARIGVGLLALQGALALVFDWTIVAATMP